MNRIAKFEKVSLNQFENDWVQTFGNKGNDIITEIAITIRKKYTKRLHIYITVCILFSPLNSKLFFTNIDAKIRIIPIIKSLISLLNINFKDVFSFSI